MRLDNRRKSLALGCPPFNISSHEKVAGWPPRTSSKVAAAIDIGRAIASSVVMRLCTPMKASDSALVRPRKLGSPTSVLTSGPAFPSP